MPRFSLVVPLLFAGLQCLYLAQSLIVVDHSTRFRRSWQSSYVQNTPNRIWIRFKSGNPVVLALASESDEDRQSFSGQRKTKMDIDPPTRIAPIGSQEEERNQKIQDRIERRANRSRKNTFEERQSEDRMDPPSFRQSRRQKHRERIRRDSDIDNSMDRMSNMKQSFVNEDEQRGTRQRRRRRRERLEQQPPSLLDSISSNPLVNDVMDYGSRAGRIARKKTGRLWDGLVNSTYGYDSFENDFDSNTSVRQSRREQRRSGFKWQERSRRPMRRSRRRRRATEAASSIDEDDRTLTDAVKFPSASYYSSENDGENDLRRQKREAKRETRQRRQQQSQKQQPQREPRFSSPTVGSTREMRSEAQQGKLPIGQILAALDERNISYSPRASRKELEDLLLDVLGDNDAVAVKNAEEDNIQVIEVESISPEDWQRQQEEKLRKKQMEQEREEEKEKEKKRKEHGQPNAKTESGKANSRYESPERGTTTRTATSNFYRRSVNTSHRPSGFSATTAKAYRSGSSGARQRRRKQSQPAPRKRTATSSSQQVSPQSAENPSVSKDETRRRIYSPFGGKRSESKQETSPSSRYSRIRSGVKDDFGDIKDDFDRFGDVLENDLGRFGDLLANSVDNIFWGTDDDNKMATAKPKRKEEEVGTGVEEEEPSTGRWKRRAKRHWKDRAEERLDMMMGVHNVGGKTYDRWTEKDTLEGEEEKAMGYDAVSYTKGRKRRYRNRNKKPFWEENDSVFSDLLGLNWNDSRSPQRSLRTNLNDAFGALRSSRTLTALLRNLLVLSVNIIRTLCKWASVRDTIPRPVVFIGGVGAGFVSRPGNRMKNSLLAFLCFRVLGEWLSEPTRNNSIKRQSRSSRVSDEDGGDDIEKTRS